MLRYRCIAIAFASSFHASCALSDLNVSQNEKCVETHPALMSDVQGVDMLSCYAAWHTATLRRWRSTNSQGCGGRQAMVVTVRRGFGDSGGDIVLKLRQAISTGQMLMIDFEFANNIWQSTAMEAPPFEYDLKKNLDVFGLSNYSEFKRVVGEPDSGYVNCVSDVFNSALITVKVDDKRVPSYVEILLWLYRPTAKVQSLVDHVLRVSKSHGERLIGVHFRTEWLGGHHSCGCHEPSNIGKCASKFVSKSAADTTTKIFVASDNMNGIAAFETAFGTDRILTLPKELPIENAVASKDDAAARIFADWLILTKVDFMIGTCGSTFSESASMVSGRDGDIMTDREEIMASCLTGAQALDYSGFALEKLTALPLDSCQCYAPGETRRGGCRSSCKKHVRPSLCSKWLSERAASATPVQEA